MKPSEIDKLSIEDLHDKLTEYRKKLSDLKLSHSVNPIENPLQIRLQRKTISRILNAISSRKNDYKT